MKTLLTLTLLGALSFAGKAAQAQDTQDTADAINEAVSKAQLELAKQLGLVSTDEPEGAYVSAPTGAGAIVAPSEPVETQDIMAAEQQFWTDYHSSGSSQGDEEGEGDQDKEETPQSDKGDEGSDQ